MGQDVLMDLDVFAGLIDQGRPIWEQHGIKVAFLPPGPAPSVKPSSAVTCEGSKKIAHLIVWSNGGADLGTARRDSSEDDPAWHSYGIVSESQVSSCLDDLTERLLSDD